MGLMDRLWRRKSAHIPSPLGMGIDSDDKPGEGGPSIYQAELAELRWAAQNEALNIARRGVDPERWDDARMYFEFERATAHDHEALRDRLASYVGQRVRDEVNELYGLAGEVGNIRDELRTVDAELVQVTKDWRAKHEEVADDELEVSRFYRLRSAKARSVKLALTAIFVVGELFITGYIFEIYFPDLIPGAGFVLALGTTLALIAVPHYAALGLKEGLTNYHLMEKQDLEKRELEIPVGVERAVQAEAADDRGFRIVSSLVGVGLLIFVLPLSYLRTTGESGEFSLGPFFFFLLLQYVISGYFFLREWLDHGHPSYGLEKLREDKERVERVRSGLREDHSFAAGEFHAKAEELIFLVQQAPRWDSHIVETYNATRHYLRHIIALEHPEAEQFITWARKPYLGSASSVGEEGILLDPVSNEHRSLEEANLLGREWWLRTAATALEQATGSTTEVEEAGWLLKRSPDQILSVFLDRYFDLPLKYIRPSGIDEEEEAAPEEEMSATINTLRIAEERPPGDEHQGDERPGL